jgi:hypothetical protein
MTNQERYERGDTVVLYHTFLTIEDKEPITVVNPRITIRHIDNSDVLITDVNEATMFLVAETTYYYKWTVPSDAFIGNHSIEFEAICDGEYQEENETIEIVD